MSAEHLACHRWLAMVAITITVKTQAEGKMKLRAKGLCHPFQETRLQKQEGLDLLSMSLGFMKL